MIDQLLITGLSGALIVFMLMGFGMIVKIIRKIQSGVTWKASIIEVLGKKIVAWISAVVFILFVLMIVAGIIISIIFG